MSDTNDLENTYHDGYDAGYAAARSELEDNKEHIVARSPSGWTLKHPLSCRPNLFDCEYNKRMEETTPPPDTGMFFVTMKENGDLLFRRQDAKRFE